jgi:hypothetical protein
MATARPHCAQGWSWVTRHRDLPGQPIRDGSQAALPGAPTGEARLLGEQGADLLHFPGWLRHDREQLMDVGEMAYDHDHQRL